MSVEKIGIPPEDSQFIQCVVPGTCITMADGSVQAAENIKIGDYILVHAGFGIQKYDEKTAEENLVLIRELIDITYKESEDNNNL